MVPVLLSARRKWNTASSLERLRSMMSGLGLRLLRRGSGNVKSPFPALGMLSQETFEQDAASSFTRGCGV